MRSLAVGAVLLFSSHANPGFAGKKDLYATIKSRSDVAWKNALQIWKWAEPGYLETKSSKLLADTIEKAGFQVKRKVAGMPTAFIAEYGKGKPIIAIMGEFDALPGLAQEAEAERKPRKSVGEPVANGYGHGCGHHLFGVASMEAAIAIKERIKAGEIKGTIRYYGCPAEEGGSAKAFMVRDGLFKDCDIALHWHPGSGNLAGDRSSLARIAVKFRFHGKAAHAAGAPEQGRSALDAVELTNHATQLMREHTPVGTRIHHVITAGGGAPNVVPNFAEVYYYVRHPKAEVVRELYRRLELCAKAGALATETKLEVNYQGGILPVLPNTTLSKLVLSNLKTLNDLNYTEEELKFAAAIRETLVKPQSLAMIKVVRDQAGVVGRGSTDVGDVSWVVPTTGFSTACWVPGTPGHSWQAVACGGRLMARNGMHLAARVLAATAYDLFTQPQTIARAKAELKSRTKNNPYRTLMKPGQKPPLDYRKPAKR